MKFIKTFFTCIAAVATISASAQAYEGSGPDFLCWDITPEVMRDYVYKALADGTNELLYLDWANGYAHMVVYCHTPACPKEFSASIVVRPDGSATGCGFQ